jgi:hypothetical protein
MGEGKDLLPPASTLFSGSTQPYVLTWSNRNEHTTVLFQKLGEVPPAFSI